MQSLSNRTAIRSSIETKRRMREEKIEKTWHPRWSISNRCDLGLSEVALVRFESDQLTAFSLPHSSLPPLLPLFPHSWIAATLVTTLASVLFLLDPSLLLCPSHDFLLLPSTLPSRNPPSGGRFHGRLTLVASIASTNGQLFFGISMVSRRDPGNVLDLVTDKLITRILVIYGVDPTGQVDEVPSVMG